MPPRSWRPPRRLSPGLLLLMRPPWEPGASPFTSSVCVQLRAQDWLRTRLPLGGDPHPHFTDSDVETETVSQPTDAAGGS